MKTKYYTSLIIALLVAGIALAMPIASVQAWGWRCARPNVTHFAGTASLVPPPVPGTMETFGEWVRITGSVVQFYYDCDDPRFTGTITNTLTSLTDPNGKSTIWSTSSHFVRADNQGTVTGFITGQGIAPDVLTAYYVGYGDGYKVILRYNGDYASGEVNGMIIET